MKNWIEEILIDCNINKSSLLGLIIIFVTLFVPLRITVRIKIWIRLEQFFYRIGWGIIAKWFQYRIFKHYKCIIPCCVPIGPGLSLPHPTGIVIGTGCIIGSGVCIYQNVTLGRKDRNNEYDYPVIGDNVVIYCSSTVVGKIDIGSRTTIGANSVVLKNTQERSVVAGIPARPIK